MRFTVGGCQVTVQFWFMALVTLSLFLDRSGMAGIGLIAVILHESGHLLMMSLVGTPPERLSMSLFGLEICQKSGSCRTYHQDAWIAAAGPLASLFFFALCWIGYELTSSLYLANLAAANLMLALLNGLPVGPLDGGQTLYALLCKKYPAETCEKIVEIVSFFVILPVALAGFLVLLQSRYNFSLLIVSGYLMLMLLLKKGRYF